MSITTEEVVTLADVEVGDDYRIELTQRQPVESYTWTQAEDLAAEILEAVATAKRALAYDFPQPSPRWGLASHAFDVLPTCRECEEGKHSACIGSAFVEQGPDVDEVECRCASSGHTSMIGEVRP